MHEGNFSDTSLEATLSKLILQHPKDFKCGSSSPITRMCVNPQCQKTSLLCCSPDCESCCEDLHEECTFARLKTITNYLNKPASCQKDILNLMAGYENHLVEELQKTNFPLAESVAYGRLEEKHMNLVREIYEKGNYKCLKGKEAGELFGELKVFS